MYNTLKIKDKEYIMYDDFVFDEITGRWICVGDFLELEEAVAEEQHNAEQSAMWEDYGCGL